jgi:hypothetical protein
VLSRRGFLGALAAALVLDPERALWVPGAKLISIPAPASPFWIDERRVQHWLRGFPGCKCPFCAAPKIGETIFVRMPQRFIPYDPQPFHSDLRQFTRIA